MSNIKCFIACAFGKEDVDLLYHKAIIKALDKHKIKGLRVDKINHNEKIDKKILDLIADSQFGISDLTYARPSVYFEAGFLEGQNKPVIYLAKKDHFNPIPKDEYGNFKIHFDLITKNIIPWEHFDNKLIDTIEKRVSLVIKPIISSIKESKKTDKARQKFNELSVIGKIAKLRSLSLGFLSRNFKSNWYTEKYVREISVITNINENRCYIDISIGETFSKNYLIYYRPGGEIWGTRWKQYSKKVPNIIVFFLSLRPIRKSTLDSSLSTCQKFEGKHYKSTLNGQNYFYFIIDNIDLDTSLKPQLLDCIEIIKKQQLTRTV
jgi:hypothetical protein